MAEWTDSEIEVAELIEQYVQDHIVGHRFYLENGERAVIKRVVVLVEDYEADWSDV